jgi:hypothetical protein
MGGIVIVRKMGWGYLNRYPKKINPTSQGRVLTSLIKIMSFFI